MKVSVSFLGTNDFYKTIECINNSKADCIHVDVADGLLVNNRTPFDKNMLDVLKKSKKQKEVHLMTLHLKKFIEVFSYIKPEYIIYEFEATTEHNKLIKYIKEQNCKVGIAISPLTKLEAIEPYLKKIDQVLVMSIIPGYGCQKFLKDTPERIKELIALRKKYKVNFIINVDGGINKESMELLNDIPLDRVASGSYVWKSANFDERINNLKAK